MFGSSQGDHLLVELLGHRPEQLNRLLSNLADVALPFTFSDQLRRFDRPGYPSFECGLPSSYYYFVPNSGWGSEKPFPRDPLHNDFVYSTDGFGLNLGCPLRLARAMEILRTFTPELQAECRKNLASSTQHLATVEELLWLDLWRRVRTTDRGEGTPGRTHDWLLAFDGFAVRLECKFRPFDWARVVDGSDFEPAADFLARQASRQLPSPPEPDAINVAAITGLAGIDEHLARAAAHELAKYSNVQVLVYRNLAGETAVFSLEEGIAKFVDALLAPQRADAFQLGYNIIHHRDEKQRRAKARKSLSSRRPLRLPPRIFMIRVPPLPLRRKIPLPTLPYRARLVKRLASGEPIFEAIVPYLAVPADR